VQVMVRTVEVPERQVRHAAPSVRLARQKRDTLPGGWRGDERRKVRGQRRQRELVDQPVPFVIPGARAGRAEERPCNEGSEKKAERISFHVGDESDQLRLD